MKTRLLMIIGMCVFGLGTNLQHADGICVKNQDWPDAPCYAIRTNDPWQIDEKKDWKPYYDYKGSEFMETKKAEMLQALNENRLEEWRIDGPEDQHENVFLYYYFQGVIPHEDGKYYEQHRQDEILQYYSEHLAEGNIPLGNIFVSTYLFAIIGIVCVVSFIIWRKTK